MLRTSHGLWKNSDVCCLDEVVYGDTKEQSSGTMLVIKGSRIRARPNDGWLRKSLCSNHLRVFAHVGEVTNRLFVCWSLWWAIIWLKLVMKKTLLAHSFTSVYALAMSKPSASTWSGSPTDWGSMEIPVFHSFEFSQPIIFTLTWHDGFVVSVTE